MATTNENVRINFLTTFNGKGANQASSQMGLLEKQAGKLGKTMLAAFSAQKVLGFLKDSVQAFAQDQKSAALLANTMKNLFMGSDTARVEDYIAKMEMATGVLDDRLRPAMETLLRATLDAGKAQELMTLALDVAAGTGKDLETVVAALQKGYLGNTTALGKLGAGLTAAELKSKDFATIQKKLAALFRGDASTAANTFQGKLDRLKVGIDQMKESIGKGLVDAFDRLAGNNGIDTMTSAMKSFGDEVGNAISGMGRLLGLINIQNDNGPRTPKQNQQRHELIKTLLHFGPLSFAGSAMDLADFNKAKTAEEKKAKDAIIGTDLANSIALTNNKKKLDLQKKQTALLNADKKATADKLALEKASFALKQAGKVFDNTAIEIAAAMNNKTLTEQDMKRVELKQTMLQLQDAIDNKDAALATKLAASVKEQQAGIQGLSSAISSMPQAPDALATLKKSATDLQEQYKTLIELQKQLNPIPAPNIQGSVLSPELGQGIAGTPLMPQGSLNQYILSPELFSQVAQKDVMIHLTLDDNMNIGAKASDYLANTSANGTPSTLRRVNPINVGLT